MPFVRQILMSGLLLATACALGGLQDEPASQPTTAPTEPASQPADEAETGEPQRVIIRADRHREVAGYILEETKLLITVRTVNDEIQSFTKPRRIIRLVEPEDGQFGTVFMRDGQRRYGIIHEDAFDGVVVEIEGISVRLKRELVDEVFLDPTFKEQYEHYKSLLRPGMTVERYRFAEWLVEHREWRLAEEELLIVLSEDPIAEARQLMGVVEAQLDMQRERDARAAEQALTPVEPRATPTMKAGTLLTDRDVNIVRVYEIDFRNPPRVTVRPDTIRRLIENHGTNPKIPTAGNARSALFRADPVDLVRLIFDVRARELYHEIEVNSEPFALNMFRQRVHNSWLMNNCATSRCHGGPDAGRFKLHRRRYTEPKIRYTNFLILERLEIDPEWPLLNYERPGDSLIVQYGLPRHLARKPHPQVPGWKPVFAGRHNKMRDQAVQWIQSMLRPRPDYPVEFEMPSPVDATAETVAVDPTPDDDGRQDR
ncbi:MAG: hypothetical protein AAF432_07345 [Planctomycetota bacterium]